MNLANLSAAKLATIKKSLHISQAALAVFALILTIAVFATSGSPDGRTGWFFGVCWLTLPVLMYLFMVPMFPRTRRFGNIYAFAIVDALAAILWLSGWAAVANYVVSGKGNGKVKDATGCDNFEYGSAAKCKISEATIIFGVVIMLLFVATTIISAQAIMEYKRTGILPNQNAVTGGAGPLGGVKATGGTAAHGDDEAFDSNMNLRNDWEVEEYDHEEYQDRYGHHGHDARQGGYSQAAMDDHVDDEYLHNGSGLRPPSYNDDHDLSSHRPASVGGPLGGETTYNSAVTYNQATAYGR